MAGKVSTKSRTGTNAKTVVEKKALVKFLQKDMKGFRKRLQYPIDYSLKGSQLFKEEVAFGEIWLYSLGSGKKYYGRVVEGLLDLNMTDNTFVGPATLPWGKYKVWVDAWIRFDMHKEFYKDSHTFTTSDYGTWSPPSKLPAKKYWQTIEVGPPKAGETYSFIWIKCRRFHWLYRVDDLLDYLREILNKYESLSKDAATVQQIARVMHTFLYILNESGKNTGVWATQKPGIFAKIDSTKSYYEHFINMMGVLYNAATNPDLWIQGGDTANQNLLNELKHLNNLAALLWHFLEQEDFKQELKEWDKVMPEEARVLVSIIGPVFARVPRALDLPSDAAPGKKVVPKNVSPNWGERFTNEIYKPFIASRRKELGLVGPAAFKPVDSPGKALPDILNSVRKYIIGTLNGISVFLITKADSAGLLTKHWEELGALLAKDASFEPHHLSRLYRAEMGKFPDTPEGKVLADVEKRLDEIFKIKDRPEKLTVAIAKTNPCAIYFLESFEVAVKGWIAILAYQKLVVDGRKELPRNIFDATGKTANFLGTGLKSTTLSNILKARKVPESSLAKITKWGKGLSFAGETVGAGVYIYDNWLKDDSVGKEVAHYTDGDAYAIESFHVAVAYGKVITAVGTGLDMTIALAPAGVALQALGYAFQFVGELLIAIWRIGAVEKKMWQEMVEQLNKLNQRLRKGNRAKLYDVDFLPEKHYNYLRAMVDDFKWLDIDKAKWRKYVESFSTS